MSIEERILDLRRRKNLIRTQLAAGEISMGEAEEASKNIEHELSTLEKSTKFGVRRDMII